MIMLAFPTRKVIMPEQVLSRVKKERSFLDREGINLLPAFSNREALDLHRAERADLIVAMLDSPEMSGEELCSIIREDEALRGVSVMLLCAETDEDYDRCLSCRANSFLKTPINMAVFLEEAHHLLNVSRRVACRVNVDLSVSIEDGGEKFPGYSENISSSGMLIITDAELNEGDPIASTFSLPEGGTLSVDSTVVRVMEGPGGKNKYGLSFVEPGEDVVTAIALFAKKHGCQ